MPSYAQLQICVYSLLLSPLSVFPFTNALVAASPPPPPQRGPLSPDTLLHYLAPLFGIAYRVFRFVRAVALMMAARRECWHRKRKVPRHAKRVSPSRPRTPRQTRECACVRVRKSHRLHISHQVHSKSTIMRKQRKHPLSWEILPPASRAPLAFRRSRLASPPPLRVLSCPLLAVVWHPPPHRNTKRSLAYTRQPLRCSR